MVFAKTGNEEILENGKLQRSKLEVSNLFDWL